jgi:O-antigen/teichoic acid export membrane protein
MFKKYLNEENRNIFWSFASKGWAAVAFILVEILLARLLPVDKYGEWQYFLSTLTIFVTISYFGVPQSAQTYAARYVGKPELRSVLKSSLVIRVFISLAFTGLILLIRNPLADLVKRPHFGDLLLVAAPLVFLMGMGEYLKNIYVGLKQTKYHFLMNVVEFGFKALLVALFLNFEKEIAQVINAYSTALFLSILVGMVIFVRAYKAAPPGEDRTKHFLGSIFEYILP